MSAQARGNGIKFKVERLHVQKTGSITNRVDKVLRHDRGIDWIMNDAGDGFLGGGP